MKNGSFKQIQENIKQIEGTENSRNDTESKNHLIEENKIEEKVVEEIIKEGTMKKEYETMPQTVKGYKVIR